MNQSEPLGQRFNRTLTEPVIFPSYAGHTVPLMSSAALDLTATTGYLVADSRGRVVGRVEAPMYGTSPDVPDAPRRPLRLPAPPPARPGDAISAIDGRSGVIGLQLVRESIRSSASRSPLAVRAAWLARTGEPLVPPGAPSSQAA